MPAASQPRHTTGVAAVVGAAAAWGLGTALSKGAIDDDLAPSLAGVALVAAGTLRAAMRGMLASRQLVRAAPLPWPPFGPRRGANLSSDPIRVRASACLPARQESIKELTKSPRQP